MGRTSAARSGQNKEACAALPPKSPWLLGLSQNPSSEGGQRQPASLLLPSRAGIAVERPCTPGAGRHGALPGSGPHRSHPQPSGFQCSRPRQRRTPRGHGPPGPPSGPTAGSTFFPEATGSLHSRVFCLPHRSGLESHRGSEKGRTRRSVGLQPSRAVSPEGARAPVVLEGRAESVRSTGRAGDRRSLAVGSSARAPGRRPETGEQRQGEGTVTERSPPGDECRTVGGETTRRVSGAPCGRVGPMSYRVCSWLIAASFLWPHLSAV